MKDPKTAGIILAVLGLVLTCAVCPLALNNLLVMATSGGRPQDIFNLYGALFPNRFGNLTLSSYVILVQESCATILALVVLVIGAIMFAQARQATKKK